MEKPQSLRLFYALWPDDKTRTNLQHLQAGLQGRLVPPENLHITLAFLGDQPLHRLPLLKRILAEMPNADMVLTLDRLGYFKRSRLTWAGMEAPPEALMTLQSALVQTLKKEEITFDAAGKFTPHVTLARNAPPPPDRPFILFTWHATHVVLVESILGAGGSRYQVLASR